MSINPSKVYKHYSTFLLRAGCSRSKLAIPEGKLYCPPCSCFAVLLSRVVSPPYVATVLPRRLGGGGDVLIRCKLIWVSRRRGSRHPDDGDRKPVWPTWAMGALFKEAIHIHVYRVCFHRNPPSYNATRSLDPQDKGAHSQVGRAGLYCCHLVRRRSNERGALFGRLGVPW
jgi:hypothetical protein